jgi:polyisoprenoid-binding protein YceI
MSNLNKIIVIFILLCIYFVFNINNVLSQEFYYKFNNKESQIFFNISTSIHPAKALCKNFKGYININSKDKKHIDSVNGLLDIETKSILTNIIFLDKKMQNETLNSSKFPKILFKVDKGIIIYDNSEIDNTVFIKLMGYLEIRGIEKKIEIPMKVTISPDKTFAIVKGYYNLNINDYGIPDPSVLIAKVSPIITLSFNLKVY